MTSIPESARELRDETAWLIEFSGHGAPSYYGKTAEDGLHVTDDHLAAIRFARAEDAQAVIDDTGWTEAKPVEHMWTVPRLAPDTSAPADVGELIERLRHFDACPFEIGDEWRKWLLNNAELRREAAAALARLSRAAPAGERVADILRDITIEQMEEEIEWRLAHATADKED